MAELRLPAPEPFDFKNPDNWAKWKRRFEQYRQASNLASQDNLRQVSTLLYCMGEEADAVLSSTNITAEGRKMYDTVMEKFDDYFQVRKNTIYERAKFNRRDQREGESSEQYITTLYELIENCEYGTLKQEMLRDRLVVGIRDVALSEKLQMDATLTLEKAKKAIRQKEAVTEQQAFLQEGSKKDPITIDEVNKGRSGRGGGARARTSKCTRCGHDKHVPGDKCPAMNATCYKCNRKGHFGARCFSKTQAAATNEMNMDTAYLDIVDAVTENKFSWHCKIQMKNTAVDFKLDTGAEVTAIMEETYKTLPEITLQETTKVLSGPTRESLEVIGQFSALLTHKDSSSHQIIFVVRGLRNNLLGLPAITALKLVNIMEANYCNGVDVRGRFGKLFQGLGKIGEDYTIKLKDNATPHALYTPRRVPIPLRQKVQEELDKMEKLGVISKVDEPTPWCAGMVVVPKPNGAVRICVDLKPLNESVLREVHPIPKVDETLALLAGAKIFSKLDANSGFWQIPLAEESRLLTTFITPAGRYCFNKLPFGISSAPELFQKRMKRILEGLTGVVCLMDDILIFGSNQTEHDERLIAVLKRLEAAGVTLNAEKCKFNETRVKFLGHLIDQCGIQADPAKTTAVLQMKPPNNITDLRRFMGMVNQLGKFSPNLSQLSQPLRELLSPKRSWLWGPNQQTAFENVKCELAKPTVLALFNPQACSKISADASSFAPEVIWPRMETHSICFSFHVRDREKICAD